MFFFYRNNNRYRPYIKYNWSTTTDPLTGVRRLKDAGTAPKFPATMYSGRGIKFNGVDQALVTDIYPKSEWTKQTISCEVKEPLEAKYELLVGAAYSPSAPSGSLSITNFNLNDGTYNDYTVNIHYEYDGVDYALTLVLSDGFKGTITGSLDFTTGEMKGYLDGKLIKSKIFNELIGKSPNEFGYPFAVGAGTTGSSAARGYFSKTLGNVIFLSDILSDTEVQYLYYNPEKFLYREDNILKSKILPQYKIDAVEFYAPMCETDGYVRDYSKYSEEILLEDDFTNGIDKYSAYNSVISNTDGDKLEIDDSANAGGWSSATINIDFIEGEYYQYDFETLNVSTAFYIGIDKYPQYSTSTTGRKTVVVRASLTGSTLYLNADGTGNVILNNFSVKKLIGVHPVTNYTSDQNVKQLSTGLQTCFWKRDILGVPEKLVTKGSISNLYDYRGFELQNPLTVFESGARYYGIEVVILPIELPSTSYFYFIRDTDGFAWLIYPDSIIRAFQKIDDTTFSNVVTFTKITEGVPKHLYLEYVDNGIDTLISTPYINGVAGTQKTYAYTTKNIQSVSEVLFNYSQKHQIETRLFNIHTEPQDPLELYNNAVKKGLLQ